MSPDGRGDDESKEPQWEPLESSHLIAMAYNADDSELLVQFKNGAIYSYTANEEEAQGLRNAESPGRYMNLMFKGRGIRIS